MEKECNKIAALVPGRTQTQCSSRWNSVFYSSIERERGSTGKWIALVEDNKLKDALQIHVGSNCCAVSGSNAKIVPLEIVQCLGSQHRPGTERTDKWTPDEDNKLQYSLQTHYCGKDWFVISTLVPGRTKEQCWCRRKNLYDPQSYHRGRTRYSQ
jgi:hypothetical protein